MYNDKAMVLAGVALEIADRLPDENYDVPRAEWRLHVLNLAQRAIKELKITIDTDDIDELLDAWCGYIVHN